MKKIIAFITMLISSVASAGSMFDGMSQEELAQYEIVVVNTANGKVVGKMSRAEYKVVRIDSSEPTTVEVPKQTFEQWKEDAKIVSKYRKGYNSVILHGGIGKNGLDYTHNNDYGVAEKDAMVVGATLCRSINSKGLCASAFTNKTFTLGLKLDF